MTSQPFPGQQQIFITTQQQSSYNQQPQIFIPNQSLTFSPNWQYPLNLDPRQQMVQYNLQQPNLPPYNQQPNANTTFSPGQLNAVHLPT